MNNQEQGRDLSQVVAVVAFIIVAIVFVALAIKGAMIQRQDEIGTGNQENSSSDITVPGDEGNGEAPDAGTDWEAETYEDDDLGLSFDYPEDYVVRTEVELEDFDEGEMRGINLFNDNDDLVFQIRATSSDFEQGVTEGCCYFFTNTLDMDSDTDELVSGVEEQLREIFLPRKTEVGGRDALSFIYATDYISTNVVAADLVPVNHDEYSNIMFTSGVLYSQDGPYDENIEDIGEIFNVNEERTLNTNFNELDLQMHQLYLRILDTVVWE